MIYTPNFLNSILSKLDPELMFVVRYTLFIWEGVKNNQEGDGSVI